MARPAVFLDRDGVLVVPEFRDGRSYAPTTLDNFRFYPEAQQALGELKAKGYALVVVSNQPDVGKGIIAANILAEMNKRLLDALPVDDIRVCTHRQDEVCGCRKPKPGMLLGAAEDWDLNLSRSYMVGDRDSDVEAGLRAGCTPVFIDLDYTEPKPSKQSATVRSLREATNWILRQDMPDTV